MTVLGLSPALVVLAETFVAGHAKTKGSLTFKGGRHVEEAVRGSGDWRKLVADSLGRASTGLHAEEGRVGVWITSYLQPYAAKDLLDPQGWIMSQRSGDVDKLARNVLDALTDSGLIGDDAQVWDVFSSKRLACPGMMPGQQIRVWAIPDGVPW